MGDFEKNARIVRERKEYQEKITGENAKNDLLDKGQKSINTTMIGALNDLEKIMGHLWGHQTKNLSLEQQRNKELWEQVRESILDRGNASYEKFKYHLGRFKIAYNGTDKKFTYNFKLSNNKDSRNHD